MKKVSIMIIILLMIISSSLIVQATETATETTAEADTSAEEIANQTDIVTDTVAEVIEVKQPEEIITGGITDTIQEITIEITEGDYIGEEFTTEYVLSYDIDGKILAYELDEGDKVIVELTEDENGNVTVAVQDIVRSNYIIIMFIFFLFSLILIGGKKGVKAIVSLLASLVFVYFVLVNRISAGNSAIFITILIAVVIAIITYILSLGLNKKTLTAVLGAGGGILVAGGVSLFFNHFAKLAGACEDAVQLNIDMSTINFDFRDLLCVGIIVSALGMCMHIAMLIVSGLDEIKLKSPDITWKDLLKDGMNIGKNSIMTASSTLLFAYIGSTLTLIILYMSSNMEFTEILNKETIAEQIIAAIAGSIGVIYTIPITSLIYSALNKDRVIYNKTSENKINGKRSLKI